MRIPENTPTRPRTVQGDLYEAAGQPDFSFDIPRPFTPEMFAEIAADLGIAAQGLSNQNNQLLAENLGNLMAARVKAAAKANEALEEGEDPTPLPSQADMDELIASYDFSGVRTGSGVSTGLSALERAIYKYARRAVRALLKQSGYPKLGLSAPVSVAKKDTDPKANELSYAVFEEEVEKLALGEDKWGEEPAFADFRQSHVVEPAEASVAADEKASVDVAAKLGFAA